MGKLHNLKERDHVHSCSMSLLVGKNAKNLTIKTNLYNVDECTTIVINLQEIQW